MQPDQSAVYPTINVFNSLGEETTVHWHGLHVSGEDDGGPWSSFGSNETYNPTFTVKDKASTYWYHPHLHHLTQKQVTLGLAGLIIVKDGEEAAINLPRTYGVDDIPLIMQTKAFTGNSINYVIGPMDPVNPINNDAVFMMNGVINAQQNVPRQVVRFRLLNGAHQRVFNVGLSNNATFYQIGSDGGLLAAPVPLTRVRLAPGERAEILVNFSTYSEGTELFLKSFASELPVGFWGATNPGNHSGNGPSNYNPNPLNGTNFDIIKLTVSASTVNPVLTIPSTGANVSPLSELNANNVRIKFLTPGTNGPSIGPNSDINPYFNFNIINDYVQLGDIEIWEIHSKSNAYHPFHIHDIQFYILSRNGVLPPLNERGRKDVVAVAPNEIVRFIAKFDDFGEGVPYMYHCHILPHEDKGMMGQFIVKKNVYVNKNFNGTENGSINNPYNTFYEAINNSPGGATINFISNGDHNEVPPTIVIDKQAVIKLVNGQVIIK
ncbi:MAG: multicopper oxidase domain-containing protein [Saprospiraceae bacterium]|nr:multicopper oxidase domain-containing protein [Saprospiraceae bacterium]